MYVYKRWLLNYLALDIDIINTLKQMIITIIQPPTYEELKLGLKNNQYIKNGIIYKKYYDTVHEQYDYVQTAIFIEKNKITDIIFGYMLKDTLFDFDFIIDFKQSNINPNDIAIYSIENNNIYYLDDDNEEHEMLYDDQFDFNFYSNMISIRSNVIFIKV